MDNSPSYTTLISKFLVRHAWWIGSIGVLCLLIFVFNNPISSTATYFGVTGIWKAVEKLLDLV